MYQNTHRVQSETEKLAYSNLKRYDQGVYSLEEKNIRKIEDSLLKKNNVDKWYSKLRNEELALNHGDINEYLEYATILNSRHSDFHPGVFKERGAYESTFGKKLYYDSEIAFLIQLFISHLDTHGFHDGNKRTALNLFLDLVDKFTIFQVKDILLIQDAQILYIIKKISLEELEKIIILNLEEQMIKSNDNCALEHLISRKDIDIAEKGQIAVNTSDRRSSFNLTDLEKSQFFYRQLRKPIFQRDTNQWTIDRVEKLITTFINDGLIPAIILWEDSNGDIYIIDGAHRISSLIAWVQSDYGVGNEIADSNHIAIKEYIDNKIGNYDEIKMSDDDKYRKIRSTIAKRSISIQWVMGDYETVKEAFLRINQQGVTLSIDEKELIEKDKLPMSIISRAVLSHGLGQISRYQSEGTRQIFSYLFQPALSADLNNYPMGGSIKEDLTISKVFNIMKIIDGEELLGQSELENKAIDLLGFISDLGLSNKLYFYSVPKRYKVSSLYAFTYFFMNLKDDSLRLAMYKKNRKTFEQLLVRNEKNIQLIARKKRQSNKAYKAISEYLIDILEYTVNTDRRIIEGKYTDLQFYALEDDILENLSAKEASLKNAYMEFVHDIPECAVCGGKLNGIHMDSESSKHYYC
ncbi:DUF262 domain-containing protein [Listeria grandensis]|uniref:GmrSD restriction endonuclease domain-containing protein n=1 Tax=Listeria grandensis TaxID=1494963 RepID=UPI0016242EEA|nr:DUF262 domain-containing protein [Listeria grandensis]MBC1475303.1 DUF262 domain-containing protein [Listeria grandensis]